MDVDVTFDDKTMKTPVYLKMDAHDQLLLSEGVCRQLGIISPPEVQTWRGGWKRPLSEQMEKAKSNEAKVPTVQVRPLQSVWLLPHQAVVAQVQLDNEHDGSEPLLLERSMQVEEETGLQIEDALLQPTVEGRAQMVLSNPSGFTQVVEQGQELGIASPAPVIQPTLGTNEDLPGQPGDLASPETKSPGPTESDGIKRVTADTVGQ